jgi:hypothetical protein
LLRQVREDIGIAGICEIASMKAIACNARHGGDKSHQLTTPVMRRIIDRRGLSGKSATADLADLKTAPAVAAWVSEKSS